MSDERLPGLVIDIETRINKLEQGLKRATERQSKAAAQMERKAKESAEKIGATYHRIGADADNAFSKIRNSFNANSYRISGVATQFGDIATQIGGGTSAIRAFGMQAAQLGGYLGPMGVLAGTAAAAVLPLAAAFLKSGEEAETLEDRVKSLSDSTGAMESAIAAAGVPVEELRLKYRDLADEIQRADGIAVTFASAIAERDAISAAKGLGNGLTIPAPGEGMPVQWNGSVNLDRQRIAVDQQRDAMEKLRNTTGATGDQLDRLRMAINRVESSNSLNAVVKDSENLLQLINELYAGADKSQRQYLESWAKQVTAVMESAKRQIAAQQADSARLVSQYDADTSKMNQLTADRQKADELLTKAKQKGDAEQVESMQRVINGIDAQIKKLQELARQSDETYKAIQANVKAAAAEYIAAGFEYVTGSTPAQFAKDASAGEKGILNLIGQRESGGNYNATLDNGKYTGGQRNLVNMTIREVLAMQRDMLKHPDNNHNSSAAGRYQIVGTTLGGKKMDGSGGLVKELGINLDDLYSPEMQDRLATQLLRRRMAQGGNTVENLRDEWTSLKGVNPTIIQSALGRQSVDRVDSGVAAAAQAAARKAEIDANTQARKQNKDAIDQQKAAQEAANDAARQAAEAQRQAAEATATGAQAMTDVFMAAGQGADAFKNKMLELAQQILAQQAFKMFSGMPGMGWLGGLLSGGGAGFSVVGNDALSNALRGTGAFFAEGGFTGSAGVGQIAGVVHGQEYVFSAKATRAIGAGNLEALHRAAKNGYRDGGLVTPAGAAKAVGGANKAAAAAPTITLNAPVTVNASGGTPEANADLARQVSAETEKALRGLVQSELVRQMRPGAVLARGR